MGEVLVLLPVGAHEVLPTVEFLVHIGQQGLLIKHGEELVFGRFLDRLRNDTAEVVLKRNGDARALGPCGAPALPLAVPSAGLLVSFEVS